MLGVDYERVLVLCSGFLCLVDWVRALTCLVPVHVRCSSGGSSLKSFTRTPRFLPALIIRCFSEVTAVLWLAERVNTINATFLLWRRVWYTHKFLRGAVIQYHTVLLRSDGRAVACGDNEYDQCKIPPLDDGLTYIQVSAGHDCTMLLRSDGHAVAWGQNRSWQCYIP